ncbi:HEAT repeat domain-containing protein [Candidatus Desantisbacteria bacterium]|nr:HEAT repeat domain-containing protein [Candidatus Desantisbacteria bacterium]
MDFKSYLNNLLSDSEIGKWSALYVPLHITESAEDLPVIPCLRHIILEETEGMIKEGVSLPEGLAWTKKRQTIQELIEGLQTEQDLSSPSSGMKNGTRLPLILIGESGSGKTTSLRYLTGLYATKCLKEIEKSGQDNSSTSGQARGPAPTALIPIFLDMGGFRSGNFTDYLLDELNNRKLSLTPDQLRALFEQNLFLVLIDGLDLLCPYEGFNPVESIQRFISQFPKNNYILSCRKGVCYTSFPANYKVIELLELTEDDVREYLGHYIKDTEKRDVVFNAIIEDPSLKDIAESPLLLLLMMATFIRYKKIPRNKTDVYSAYINCLYDLFEKMGKLVETDKKIIAQGLAMMGFTLQMHNATVLDKQEVVTLFKNIANQSGYNDNPPEKLLHLCTQLGIVRIQKNEVKFFYQSFREYFAAEHLKRLFLQNIDLSTIYNHPRWEDVLVYLSGLMDIANTSGLVKTILNMPYKYRNPLFLAAECVASGDVEEAIENKVVGLLRERLNDRYWYNQREALYGLARIAGRAVRKQASLSDKMAKDYLDGTGKDKAIDIFIQRISDEDWIRQEKSARALGKVCDREVIPYLERLLADESPSVYNAAFEAIIEIERRERENVKISFPQMQEDILPKVVPIKGEKKKEIEIIPPSVAPHPKIMPEPLPAGKITIAFMSIKRSLELIRQIGETRGLTGLQVYNNIIKHTVTDCQGKILKFTGGTFVALFEEPDHAIDAAVKVQKAIDEYNLRQPSRKLYMRIGMVSGNPQPQTSLTSIEVNLAV